VIPIILPQITETNEATGIFEGTVFFTVNNESSGHRLRVAEGDTVTAEYEVAGRQMRSMG
jgi:hypothetical protein